MVHRGGRGGRGAFTKKQYIRRELRKKGGGAWTVCSFKNGFGNKEGGVFLRGGSGVDIPVHTKRNIFKDMQPCLCILTELQTFTRMSNNLQSI